MNLHTIQPTLSLCQVCTYPFADKHHIWPQAKGGKQLPTINFCPNHHRFANLVQAMVLQGRTPDAIRAFGVRYFDRTFLEILDWLIEAQQQLSGRGLLAYQAEAARRAIENPAAAIHAARVWLAEAYAQLDRYEPDALVPVADFAEALAHLSALLAVFDSSVPDETTEHLDTLKVET